MDTPETNPNWERRLLEKIAFASIKEQRARRRWGIFFKLAVLAYLIAGLVLLVDWEVGSEKLADGKHTALVNVRGVINSTGDATAEKINGALQSAFEDKRTAGVILRINSPGGSPVQSGIVYDEIRRLRAKYPDIALYVVVEDLCASGGYYIASAADRIFVDKASVVGSIGVLMDGFGFTGTMEKLGIERRLLTSGDNKGMLDPFSPLSPEHKAHAQTMLTQIHQQFIDVVRKNRSNRLKENPDTFSGMVWTGQQAIQMGLADQLGSINSVARDVVKQEKIVDYTKRENVAEKLVKKFGVSVGVGMVQAAKTQSSAMQ